MKCYFIGTFFFWLTALLLFGCTIADDDRCGDAYEWDDALGACALISSDTGTGTGVDTNVVDSGTGQVDTSDTDTGQTGTVELGQSCSSDADCVQYSADMVCVGPPGAMYCSITCTTAPDNCPTGFTCCANAQMGSFCMTDAEYAQMGAMICAK